MHINQDQIDMINKKYKFLDESALDELIKRQYNLYAFGTETKINNISPTIEWKNDIKSLYKNYPEFNVEEIDLRIKCQFENLFKNTFSHLVQNN